MMFGGGIDTTLEKRRKGGEHKVEGRREHTPFENLNELFGSGVVVLSPVNTTYLDDTLLFIHNSP